jgi:hypothetical protein
MSLWKYFFERAAYDATRSAVRGLARAPVKVAANPRDIYLGVWERSIRGLSHKKYELIRVDRYGLEDEDAWIDYLKSWFRREMLPALKGFSPTTLTHLNNTEMPALMKRLDAMVAQIRQHEAANTRE